LALQMRSDDPRTSFIAGLADAEAGPQVEAERAVLRALEGGCQLPFGAQWDTETQRLRCFLQTEEGPLRAFAKTSSQALEDLRAASSREKLSVLITRAPRNEGPLKRMARAQGLALTEFPLIQTVALSDPSIPTGASDADWVWIGSPGAARAAESWLLNHPSMRIATPGHGTAESLPQSLQKRLGFIGSGHPLDAWQAFAAQRTENEGVAIPHSARSLKRWESKEIPGTLYAWAHYSPVSVSASPPETEIVCFTSPSNVEAWSQTAPSRIVAFGSRTSAALELRNWPHTVARTPDDFGILEAVLAME
ncbi:MAG: uroporphyrinogen-III synthase, partial [Flavobacteriales bacterium]